MELSEIFEKAGKLIKSGQHEFICMAIYNIDGVHYSKLDDAGSVIMDRLGDRAYYHRWVELHHPEVFNNTPRWRRDAMARKGRIAWCKSLAKEFKAKGQ